MNQLVFHSHLVGYYILVHLRTIQLKRIKLKDARVN